MTRTARLRIRVAKEIRELAPAWLACLLAMAAAAAADSRGFRELGLVAYFLGASALGALSVGHEYSHRTISMLLSQPARRADLLLVKLSVLAAMLLTFRAIAGALLLTPSESILGFGSHTPETLALWLPVLYGLSVAPWLTMLCRSSMAGTVLTPTLSVWLWVVGALVGRSQYGLVERGARSVWAFQFAFLWKGTLALCAVGVVMSWRKFVRLEAIDGPGPDVRLPHWLVWQPVTRTAAPARSKRHPLWLLAKKELRLQQMTLIVAGAYVLGWLTVTSLRTYFVSDVLGIFFFLTIFYSLLVSLLIGSLASAEERQFGTLEWQVLVPMATWKQWAVKVGVALGLAMLLAVAVPALLSSISPATDPTFPGRRAFVHPSFVASIITISLVSVYVSSVSTSGLRALLVSLATMLGAWLFARVMVVGFLVQWLGFFFRPFPRVFIGMTLLFAAAFFGSLLRFGLANHRSADRGADRVWRQVIWMAGSLTMGVTLLARLLASLSASVHR